MSEVRQRAERTLELSRRGEIGALPIEDVTAMARDVLTLMEGLTGEGIDYSPEMLRALATDLPHDAKNYIEGCADALAGTA